MRPGPASCRSSSRGWRPSRSRAGPTAPGRPPGPARRLRGDVCSMFFHQERRSSTLRPAPRIRPMGAPRLIRRGPPPRGAARRACRPRGPSPPTRRIAAPPRPACPAPRGRPGAPPVPRRDARCPDPRPAPAWPPARLERDERGALGRDGERDRAAPRTAHGEPARRRPVAVGPHDGAAEPDAAWRGDRRRGQRQDPRGSEAGAHAHTQHRRARSGGAVVDGDETDGAVAGEQRGDVDVGPGGRDVHPDRALTDEVAQQQERVPLRAAG